MKLEEAAKAAGLDLVTRLQVVPGRYYRGRLRTLDQAHRRWFAKVRQCTVDQLIRHEQSPFMDWYVHADGSIRAISPRFVWYDDAFRKVEYLRVTRA